MKTFTLAGKAKRDSKYSERYSLYKPDDPASGLENRNARFLINAITSQMIILMRIILESASRRVKNIFILSNGEV
jgi:hypothetical protein